MLISWKYNGINAIQDKQKTVDAIKYIATKIHETSGQTKVLVVGPPPQWLGDLKDVIVSYAHEHREVLPPQYTDYKLSREPREWDDFLKVALPARGIDYVWRWTPCATREAALPGSRTTYTSSRTIDSDTSRRPDRSYLISRIKGSDFGRPQMTLELRRRDHPVLERPASVIISAATLRVPRGRRDRHRRGRRQSGPLHRATAPPGASSATGGPTSTATSARRGRPRAPLAAAHAEAAVVTRPGMTVADSGGEGGADGGFDPLRDHERSRRKRSPEKRPAPPTCRSRRPGARGRCAAPVTSCRR